MEGTGDGRTANGAPTPSQKKRKTTKQDLNELKKELELVRIAGSVLR